MVLLIIISESESMQVFYSVDTWICIAVGNPIIKRRGTGTIHDLGRVKVPGTGPL
jgi:hypothetical protein